MGIVIINGKRFVGNNVTISNGKFVIDGKAQDGELSGDLEAQVIESISGGAECGAFVTCGEVRGHVTARASATDENVGGSVRAESSVISRNGASGIRAAAFASTSKR